MVLITLGLIAALTTAVGGVASAAPGDDVTTNGSTQNAQVNLGWKDLGMASTIVIDSVNTAQDFTVPVPQGAQPVRLTGNVRTAVNVGAGFLEINDGTGRFLASVPLPATNRPVLPFSANIAAAAIQDGFAPLQFVVRQTAIDTAAGCGPPQEVTLTDLATEFTGTAGQPSTIEEFLPPLLSGIDLYVDDAPTEFEQQATLNLVAALTRTYRPVPVAVTVVPLDRTATPPASSDPLRRSIAVRDQSEAAITVIPQPASWPYLTITGSEEGLVQQTVLFADTLTGLAQVPTATVTSGDTSTVNGTNTMTFSQLGASGSVTVLGQNELFIGFDSGIFGLSKTGDLDVHLLADYTPVDDDSAASVVVRSGDIVLDSGTLDESGKFDSSFTIPAQAVIRNVGLTLTVAYSPRIACTPYTAPMTFTVDPRSSVTSTGKGSAAEGFAALPVAFEPSFQVAFDGSDSGELSRAASVVAGLQQLTGTPLRPEVVGLEQAAGSGSGALIVANATSVADVGLNPPLSGNGESVSVDVDSKLSMTMSGGVGSVQVFADNGRSVALVTTTGQWSLVDPALSYAADQEARWASLTGDVLAAGPAQVTEQYSIRSGGSSLFTPAETSSWKKWALLGVGVSLLLIAFGVGGWLFARRRGRGGEPQATHQLDE